MVTKKVPNFPLFQTLATAQTRNICGGNKLQHFQHKGVRCGEQGEAGGVSSVRFQCDGWMSRIALELRRARRTKLNKQWPWATLKPALTHAKIPNTLVWRAGAHRGMTGTVMRLTQQKPLLVLSCWHLEIQLCSAFTGGGLFICVLLIVKRFADRSSLSKSRLGSQKCQKAWLYSPFFYEPFFS